MAKITKELDCHCVVYARLAEDGTASVVIRGQSEYASGAFATAEVEVPSTGFAGIVDALRVVLEAGHEACARAADDAATIARQRDAERIGGAL